MVFRARPTVDARQQDLREERKRLPCLDQGTSIIH